MGILVFCVTQGLRIIEIYYRVIINNYLRANQKKEENMISLLESLVKDGYYLCTIGKLSEVSIAFQRKESLNKKGQS